ncbi:hypothetical protein [Caballeronia mineralivorans]|uniref:hypothetical protein n=1 Tax=Caballeronia mineralivorans TaxID=2010198 RepID=UPI00069F7420|nr:hypothetical protein [Caballeronia mineralivorans]
MSFVAFLFDGETLEQIAERTGIHYSTLYARYQRHGHPLPTHLSDKPRAERKTAPEAAELAKQAAPRRSSAIDITGKVFGRLTAIRKVEDSKNGKTRWEFVCSCGTFKPLLATQVTTGKVKSCGCLRGQSYFDITGERYGMLTATAYVERGTRGARWRFTCDCGSSIVATAKDIRYGGRTDCGCQAERGSVVRTDLRRRVPPAAPQGDVFAGLSVEQLARLANTLGIDGDAGAMVTFARAIAARHASAATEPLSWVKSSS